MPSNFSNPNDGSDARERFYQLDAVPDPVLEAAKTGRGHYNAATGRTLFHQSVMPMGSHAGKLMEQVPAKYFLTLVARSWFTADRNDGWEHVHRYVTNHLQEIKARAAQEFEISNLKSQIPLSAPMMPLPIGEPPALPWPAEARMALHRDLGFTCGPFSIMAATGIGFEDLGPVLKKLDKPYRGWMNPTQMRDTLRLLDVSTMLDTKRTQQFITSSRYRWCIARVQWEGPGGASRIGGTPAPFSGEFAGWRNVMESYKHTHYVAQHDGWILCTAQDPTQWITATQWGDTLLKEKQPWHLTHRWMVGARKS